MQRAPDDIQLMTAKQAMPASGTAKDSCALAKHFHGLGIARVCLAAACLFALKLMQWS